MELEDLAAHFKQVRLNGRGFQAECPAHEDRDPSLTVSRGETGWLVTCFAGCTFADVVAATGLPSLAFKFGGRSESTSLITSLAARRKLRAMIEEIRPIPYRLGEIAEVALCVPAERMRDIRAWYPTWVDLPLKDALKMQIVMMDTVIWDMLGKRRREYGSDWVEAKREIGRLLWVTYQDERSSLME
jgi:hypothetical protein